MAVVGTIAATELTPLVAPAAVWTGEQIAGGAVALWAALGIGAVEAASEDANEDPDQTKYVEPTPEYEPYAPIPVTHRRRKSPNSSANELGEDLADISGLALAEDCKITGTEHPN